MEILELPEKIAAAKGIHLIVCIDEFQQLALLPGYKSMEGKMRSAWQKQQQVSYCFYGSKRHMMMDIFNNSSNPFYRFGQVLFLQKIKKEEWVPFIVNAFHRTNKEISEQQAEQLCDIVKCHSWYLQQLCYFIWSGTSEKVTDEIIEIRTRQLIDTNMPMFMNDTENLTAAQTAMLRAVADGEYRFNSIPVVRKYELGSAQTITRNKRMLTERDFIEKEGNKYAFSDRYSSFGSGGSIAEYKKERGTACYPSSLKALRKPHYTNEQTADPRRNQRRNRLYHSCVS